MGRKRLRGAAKEAYANKRARLRATKKQKSIKAQEQTEGPVESPTESQPPVAEIKEPIEGPVEAELKEIESNASQETISVEAAQEKLNSYEKISTDDRTALILEELLKVIPPEGQQNLSRDIVGREQGALTSLASDIKAFFISQLKATGGRTPAGSDASSEKSGEFSSQKSAASAGKRSGKRGFSNSFKRTAAKKRKGQRTLKRRCLHRDGNRCVITGYYDHDKFWELDKEHRKGLRDSRTECVHVIPYSAAPAWMGQSVDIEDATEKAKTWAYLYRYFPGVRKIINAMASGSINSPQNAMTMVPSLHTEFGNFNFGLSHRGGNLYEIVTFERLPWATRETLPKDCQIKLQTEADIDLPDPMLPEIHLAICKVLHATGLAEQIDDYLRDLEDDEIPAASKLHVAEWIMCSA